MGGLRFEERGNKYGKAALQQGRQVRWGENLGRNQGRGTGEGAFTFLRGQPQPPKNASFRRIR